MVTTAASSGKLPSTANHYPIGPRRPMASLNHDRARQTAMNLLLSLLAPTHLVASELLIMFNSRDLRAHLTPDMMVSLDAGEDDPRYEDKRLQYRIWDEGKPPELVIELASPSTVERDEVGKKEDYAAMGVREYVLFDPIGTMLRPRLQVYRLGVSRYEPAPADPAGMVDSAVVAGYAWVRVGDLLRLWDRASGRLLPTPEERADHEARRADHEARRADQEAGRATLEARARRQAEARIRELEVLLRAQSERPTDS
ncbi:MAG TPA: Uma2 family endonuclease [Chloroflexota bacterium]|nr:Uma2 family endonuclease [Chloroflexota bacterium]